MKKLSFILIFTSALLLQACFRQPGTSDNNTPEPVESTDSTSFTDDTDSIVYEEDTDFSDDIDSSYSTEEDGPSFVATIMEFYSSEDADAFIQEHNIKNVKRIETIEGPFWYLIMPVSETIQLRLTNAEYDEQFNFFEGPELYGEALTGCPMLFSYAVPEGIPSVVVTAVDEAGRHKYWHPEYSGLDSHLIMNDDFVSLATAYED